MDTDGGRVYHDGGEFHAFREIAMPLFVVEIKSGGLDHEEAFVGTMHMVVNATGHALKFSTMADAMLWIEDHRKNYIGLDLEPVPMPEYTVTP